MVTHSYYKTGLFQLTSISTENTIDDDYNPPPPSRGPGTFAPLHASFYINI